MHWRGFGAQRVERRCEAYRDTWRDGRDTGSARGKRRTQPRRGEGEGGRQRGRSRGGRRAHVIRAARICQSQKKEAVGSHSAQCRSPPCLPPRCAGAISLAARAQCHGSGCRAHIVRCRAAVLVLAGPMHIMSVGHTHRKEPCSHKRCVGPPLAPPRARSPPHHLSPPPEPSLPLRCHASSCQALHHVSLLPTQSLSHSNPQSGFRHFSVSFSSFGFISFTLRTLLAWPHPPLLRICFTQNIFKAGSLYTLPSSCAEKRSGWITYVRGLVRARNERTHKTSLAHVERSPCKPSQEAGKDPTWQRVFPIHNHGDGNKEKERE
jgi:hypothetical protein